MSISVIIPCFNCEKTLRRAVDSVLSQTLLPDELILVDDCSADGTAAIIAEFAHLTRIRVMAIAQQINQGAAAARNIGMDAATGDYVAFLDSDDTWDPRKLRIQYDFMQKNPELELCGHVIGLAGDPAEQPAHGTGSRPISLANLLLKNHLNTPSVMMRRSNYRFDPVLRYSEDLALWLDIAASGAKIAKLEATLGFVHKAFYGASGLSSSILEMELGELRNFVTLFKRRHISLCWFVAASCFSLSKFVRRVILILAGRMIDKVAAVSVS